MRPIVEEDPVRAIRNALERLARASAGTALEYHVEEESKIIRRALCSLVSGVSPGRQG